MDTKKIGTFLLSLRKEKGFTQKELAQLCNVSAQAVSKWERGESVPDIELLKRLSDLYSVSINEIVNGERHETYKSSDKNHHIISLSISILVFIAYLFNFAEIRIYSSEISWSINIYKGYELIFNGISGWQVYLTWFVFMILVSHLILNIFIVSKVIDKLKAIEYYFLISSLIVIVISMFSMAHQLFYAFPQFIIFILTNMTFILRIYKGDSFQLLNELKKFKQYKKSNDIPVSLQLNNETVQSIQMKLMKSALIINIVLFGLYLVNISIVIANSIINNYQNEGLGFLILMAFIHLIASIVLISAYKYIGTIYTSFALKINIGLSIYLILSVIAILQISNYIILLPILLVLFTFIYGTITFKNPSNT